MQLKIWLLFYISSIFYTPPIIINGRCIALKKRYQKFWRIKIHTSLKPARMTSIIQQPQPLIACYMFIEDKKAYLKRPIDSFFI
jgi:hypothetical protein